MPFIDNQPLFYSGLTLRTRLNNVNWTYLKRSLFCIVPAALIGVLRLISLPNLWLVAFIYTVTP